MILNKLKFQESASTQSVPRRHRHSFASCQTNYFKMFSQSGAKHSRITTSTNSLFSTAVISGSSSAPNLRDMIPNTSSPSGKSLIRVTFFWVFLVSLFFVCRFSNSPGFDHHMKKSLWWASMAIFELHLNTYTHVKTMKLH